MPRKSRRFRESRAGSALAVDDPAASEVVRRDLDLYAISRIDADPVAARLAGGVAEGLVAVVERDLVHAVAEGLDDLALELDLLLFPCHVHLLPNSRPPRPRGRGGRRSGTTSRSRRRWSLRGPSSPHASRTPPSHPRRGS